MKDIENLFDKAVTEIERMLNSKTVVGEPITVEGNTLIPLINVGFGFGAGGNLPRGIRTACSRAPVYDGLGSAGERVPGD